MVNIIKFILFLLVNAGGYYTIPVIMHVVIMTETYPQLSPVENDMMRHWLFGIGTWVWVAAAFLSVGYFFVPGKIKVWLILAPLYIPAIYGVSTLIYFTYFLSLA